MRSLLRRVLGAAAGAAALASTPPAEAETGAVYSLAAPGATPLYVRNPWDSAVAYAIDHHMTVIDANLLLDSLGQSPLLV